MKQKITPQELCKNLPEEFVNIIEYVKKLTFTEKPDYQFLQKQLKDIAQREGFPLDTKWDWKS